MFGWHVPAPNEAMLVSGGRQKGSAPLPFKIVTGHGAWVLPVRSRVYFLTLALQESVVTEECVTQQGITLLVKSVIAFKVGDDPESIANAARRFLSDQDQMSTLTGQVFAGHLRSIVGSMTVENIIRERQTLAEQVLDASKREMAKIGLAVDSLQIQSIDDKGSGYIAALAAPHTAAVNRQAQIAQAQADQASAEARQASLRQQAEYERETAVARADYQSQIDMAQSKAGQAGPLAAAQAQQEVLVEQAKVAAKNAELREAQLIAEIVKPAEAEAQRIRTLAQAEADRTRMSAQAAGSENRIALDQAIIAQLPQMIQAASAGLASANVTVLNGAEGLNGTVAALASQGMAILHAVTDGLGAPPVHREGDAPADKRRPAGYNELEPGEDGKRA
jgi:flotillin